MPRGVEHRRVARRDSTVRRQEPSPIRGCGTPVATAPPRTVSRLQPFVATDSEGLLRPRLGDGRNTMLRSSWCASPMFESVHGRLGSSRVIEEQSEGQHRWGEERLASRRAAASPVRCKATPVEWQRRGGVGVSKRVSFDRDLDHQSSGQQTFVRNNRCRGYPKGLTSSFRPEPRYSRVTSRPHSVIGICRSDRPQLCPSGL